MSGKKIDVSGVHVDAPVLNISGYCKLKSSDTGYRICRDFIDIWQSRYHATVRGLRKVLEGRNGITRMYFEGRRIGHLEIL